MKPIIAMTIAMWATASSVCAADSWNAMAIDNATMTVGMAVDQSSKGAAEALAKKECLSGKGKQCATIVSREGGCLAISRNEDGSSLGYGMEATIQATVVEALNQCFDGDKYTGCTVHSNTCSNTGS